MEGDNSLSKPSDVELILDTNETQAKDVHVVNGSVHYAGEDVVANGEVGSSPEKVVQENAKGIEQHRNGHQNGGAKSSLGDEEIVKPAPSDSWWTVQGDGAVNLLTESSGSRSRVPITVVQGLQRAVRVAPSRVALAVKRNGEWVKWTYQEYYDSVRSAAKSFIKVCSITLIYLVGPEFYHFVTEITLGCAVRSSIAFDANDVPKFLYKAQQIQ